MKAWKEYIFIYIPIGIFCCVINFCVKKDNKSPNVRQYFFYEFEKNEYSMNDLYSGNKLGNISLCMDNGEISFSLYADETSGKYLVGTTENIYLYEKIALNDIMLEKKKYKNVEFYSGKVGDWYTAVIVSLDRFDYSEYYKSNNKNRYLLYIMKNGDYNFSIKDISVYDAYICFGSSLTDMRYAAILE